MNLICTYAQRYNLFPRNASAVKVIGWIELDIQWTETESSSAPATSDAAKATQALEAAISDKPVLDDETIVKKSTTAVTYFPNMLSTAFTCSESDAVDDDLNSYTDLEAAQSGKMSEQVSHPLFHQVTASRVKLLATFASDSVLDLTTSTTRPFLVYPNLVMRWFHSPVWPHLLTHSLTPLTELLTHFYFQVPSVRQKMVRYKPTHNFLEINVDCAEGLVDTDTSIVHNMEQLVRNTAG